MADGRESPFAKWARIGVDEAWDAPEEFRGDIRAKERYFASLQGFAPPYPAGDDQPTDPGPGRRRGKQRP